MPARRADRIKEQHHITRIAYLAKICADARIVIAVRHPVDHIASIARQHQINLEQYSTPSHLNYLRNAGHFEFGRGRIPIALAVDKTRCIQDLWDWGRKVEGWAEYWNAVYTWTREEVLQNEALAARCMVVPFEKLCVTAEAKITAIITFCNLDAADGWVEDWVAKIAYQPKYSAPFTAAERQMIMNICGETAVHYGYHL